MNKRQTLTKSEISKLVGVSSYTIQSWQKLNWLKPRKRHLVSYRHNSYVWCFNHQDVFIATLLKDIHTKSGRNRIRKLLLKKSVIVREIDKEDEWLKKMEKRYG